MTSGVPWQVKGVRPEAIETAREAARRSGMSVAEWLDSIISESAHYAGVDTRPPPRQERESDPVQEVRSWRRRYSDFDDRQRGLADISDVNTRLDSLSRQIDDLAQTHAAREREHQSSAETPRLITEALSRLDQKIDRLVGDGRPAGGEYEWRAQATDPGRANVDPRAAAGYKPASPVDEALAEIEARQRALDGEAPAPRMEFARAPTQGLPNLEQQLRQINARMETMRPCGLDHAVDTLRDDLAEIGVMLKDAPRQAVDSLRGDLAEIGVMLKDAPRQTVDSLRGDLAEIGVMLKDAPRQAVDSLRGDLAEIGAMVKDAMPRQAIDTLRDDLAEIGVMLKDAMPRQAIEALESEVKSLTARIDDKRHAGADGVAIAGVERGLAEVRDALRGLTPAENLVGLDEAVNHLSQKIDRVGGTDPAAFKQLEGAILALRGVVSQVGSDDALAKLAEEVRALSAKVDHVTATDAFSIMERRIASIADSLQSHPGSSTDTRDLEAVVASLSDKIERLHATRADQGAVAHLENRIGELVMKLDASDARLNQLQSIEHGLADLLNHLEHERTWAVQRGAQESAETDALKRDVQRTQDSLENVHGALGQVVDRLATIETSLRTAQLPRVANIQAPATPAIAPLPAPAGLHAQEAAPVPPMATEPSVPAAQARPTAAAAAAPVAGSGPAANPSPAPERRPIDPNLPPDHPLEPGAVRGRTGGSPADRIAASEAALENVRPPVIPDPGGKSNFIAAARRAAQAAIVEAPPPKEKSAAAGATASITGKLSGKIRKLMVGAGVALFVLGSLHFVATRLWFSGPSASPTTQIPSEDRQPVPHPAPAPTGNVEPAAPSASPERQSNLLPPAAAIPPSPLATAMGLSGGGFPATVPSAETTGSIRQPQTPAMPSAPQASAAPAAPVHGNGAEHLPPGIGNAGLRAAAAKGDPAAAFEIASRFADGRSVPQNLAEAASWFERAASKGLAPAQFRLGGLYEKGLGVRKNLDTARRLYLGAAEAGHAKAMHNLAVLYAEGVEGKPDYQTAARWFRKAADHGVVDSQYNLAILYARGIGVETNLAEAFKWFALASREGDRDAAKKRDDVAGRLDKQSLTAAMTAAQAWQAQPQPEAAVHVAVPSGGWDSVPAPSAAKRRVGPKVETSRRPAQ